MGLLPFSLDDSADILRYPDGPTFHIMKALERIHGLREKGTPRGWSLEFAEKFASEILNAMNEWPLNAKALLDFRQWNLEMLIKRDPTVAKPRIELFAYFTQGHGNLTVRWRPARGAASDFGRYLAQIQFGAGGFERPENELLFIKDAASLENLLERGSRGPYSIHPESAQAIGGHLVQALKDLYRTAGHFLLSFCEVTVVDDIEIKREREAFEAPIVGWELYDVRERRLQMEHEWLSSFEISYGVSAEGFLEVVGQERGWGHWERTSRRFGKAGIRLTPKMVEQITLRLDKYHADLVRRAGPKPSGGETAR